MKYIADVVGDDYLYWEPDKPVLISTPTGSGKTTFVLKKLLPHAIEQGKVILYLCNRKILKEQFSVAAERELELIFTDDGGIPDDMRHAIHIRTYQYFETSRRFPDFDIATDLSKYSREEIARMEWYHTIPENKEISAADILYCIFDEAHYILSDSQFNAKSGFWAHANMNSCCINVFLTATPDPLLTALASKFEIHNYIQEIHSLYVEKAALKKNLSKPDYEVSVAMGKNASLDIRLTPQREIDARCREIEPYTKAIYDLNEKRQRFSIRTYTAQLFGDPYKNITTSYFCDWDEIIPQIMSATPQNKWMVFVDRERDGQRLLGRLEQAGIPSAFLTAESIKRSGVARKELRNITEDRFFESNVLLATSVMDCGVSIVDPFVKNVIIAQHNKTTFLQMLGRLRMPNDESTFCLHLKFYSAQSINGVRHEYDMRLRYLTDFALLNECDYKQTSAPTEKHDGLSKVSILSKSDKRKVVEKSQISPYPSLFYDKGPHKNTSEGILGEYEVSKPAYLSLLVGISEYLNALKDYRNNGDPLFYLKRQLQWINKEYAEENWIGYYEAREHFVEFLEEQADFPMMTDSEKNGFSQRCLEFFEDFPLPPVVWKNDLSRFRRGVRLPGLKHLNSALLEKELPFTIVAKQKTKNGSRSTVWILQRKS